MSVYMNIQQRSRTSKISSIRNGQMLECGNIISGWTLVQKIGDKNNFTRVTDIHISQMRYLIELTIDFKCKEITLCGINGLRKTNTDLSLNEDFSMEENISTILEYINSFTVCTGFIKNQIHDSVIRSPERENTFIQREVQNKVISNSCQLLTDHNICCPNCAYVKRTLMKLKLQFEDLEQIGI